MLFTWDTTDLCIVFRGWHISGTGTLIFSLLAIVLLTAGYEAVREISRRYEAYEKKVLEGRRGGDDLRGESHHLDYNATVDRRQEAGSCTYYAHCYKPTFAVDGRNSLFLTLHLCLVGHWLSTACEDITPNESSSLLGSGRNAGRTTEQQMKIVKAILYAVQVFYSFFIM
jgi:copper transporter 1